MKTKAFLFLLGGSMLTVCLSACSNSKKEAGETDGVIATLPEEKNEVTVQRFIPQAFHHELVSNGKVTAGELANLRFEATGIVAAVYVKNGDRVRKGDKLAELDKFRLHNKTVQAKDALERARLEFQDVLIGQGFAAGDTASVPPQTLRLARTKSGYDQNLAQYQLAQYEEANATLTAPFDGIVANLFSKPFNAPSSTEPFCTLISTQAMEVNFSVLESELSLIKKGDKVQVTPYADPTTRYPGVVSEINPLVDDKGMVRVKASVHSGGQLFDGMNVHVSVHRSLAGQWVVPKSAVVIRSGRQVLFTLKNGRARWNYVKTGLENAESYTVTAEETDAWQEGDTIIVTGTINLAHEAEVNYQL
ncbi:MAG: efflux RND transporter periplasmic adaptor subunit [Prevotellaceae bacterium]|jgi:RND family efflux transporter MFP subunit|nr:efflux RND transporter periplasmic adaptor subunit [Prevotellaceae bacterium]